MKKKYSKPAMKVIKFNSNHILCASGQVASA